MAVSGYNVSPTIDEEILKKATLTLRESTVTSFDTVESLVEEEVGGAGEWQERGGEGQKRVRGRGGGSGRGEGQGEGEGQERGRAVACGASELTIYFMCSYTLKLVGDTLIIVISSIYYMYNMYSSCGCS